jgi:hypothetical protein
LAARPEWVDRTWLTWINSLNKLALTCGRVNRLVANRGESCNYFPGGNDWGRNSGRVPSAGNCGSMVVSRHSGRATKYCLQSLKRLPERLVVAELKSLRECYSSAPECVAPTVLRFTIATVPGPSGLGYVVARLRRSGFGARALALWLGHDRFEYVDCSSRLSAGDAKDRSPVRKHWVHDNVKFRAP